MLYTINVLVQTSLVDVFIPLWQQIKTCKFVSWTVHSSTHCTPFIFLDTNTERWNSYIIFHKFNKNIRGWTPNYVDRTIHITCLLRFHSSSIHQETDKSGQIVLNVIIYFLSIFVLCSSYEIPKSSHRLGILPDDVHFLVSFIKKSLPLAWCLCIYI